MTRVGSGAFYLPTDRKVTWKVVAVLYADGATGFDNNHYCEYGFLPNYNGGDFVLWATTGLHQAWGTHIFEATIPMSAGWYSVNLGMFRITGNTTAGTHFGVDSQGFGRRGIEFTITDAGVAV